MTETISPLNLYVGNVAFSEDWDLLEEKAGVEFDEDARLIISDIANDYYCRKCYENFAMSPGRLVGALKDIYDATNTLYEFLGKYDLMRQLPPTIAYNMSMLADEANRSDDEFLSSKYFFETARVFKEMEGKSEQDYINSTVSQMIEASNQTDVQMFGPEHGAIACFSEMLYALMSCVTRSKCELEKHRDINVRSDKHLETFLLRLRGVFRQNGGDNSAVSLHFSRFAITIYDKIRASLRIYPGINQKHITNATIRYCLGRQYIDK